MKQPLQHYPNNEGKEINVMKKALIHGMALLLLLAPVLGATGGKADAATSRVAVIQSLKGTVTVNKSGGSKQFKAFARMSLNEGDVLTTAADSTAVLQFANGTKEDDKMTVSANTKLSFSKLSERGGTRTKVSMWSGSAWVDVKSITNKNDEFTMETPTAVMGVRGTHFLIGVDPETNTTILGVLSGIVNAARNAGTAGAAGTGDSTDGTGANVYPTQQFMFGTDDSDPLDHVSTIDLDSMVSMLSPDMIRHILEQKAEIDEELELIQEQMRQQMEDMTPSGPPDGLSGIANEEELQQLIDNMNRVIGALIGSAVQNQVISQEMLDQIINEVNLSAGSLNFDVTLELTDRQRAEREKAREREEARRKAAREAEEKRNKAKDDLKDKKKELEEKNNELLDRLREQQREAYERQLTEAERARFERDRQEREAEGATNASSDSNSGNEAAGGTGGNSGGSGGNDGGDTGSGYVNPLAGLIVDYSEPAMPDSPQPTPSPMARQITVPVQSAASSYPSDLDYVTKDEISLNLTAKNTTDQITVKTRISSDEASAILVPPEYSSLIDSEEGPVLASQYRVKLRGKTTYIDIWVKNAANETPTKFTYQVNRQLLPAGVTVTESSGIPLADIGGNRLLLEGAGGAYEFTVNGQGIEEWNAYGNIQVDKLTNKMFVNVPDDGVFRYPLEMKVNGRWYDYELIVKTSVGSPFASTDRTWIESGLEVTTAQANHLDVSWDGPSSSFLVNASAADGDLLFFPPSEESGAASFTVEAVEDVTTGKVLTQIWHEGRYGYWLETGSPAPQYKLYLRDESGQYTQTYDLRIAANPWPTGVLEMKMEYRSSLNGGIDDEVALKLNDYSPYPGYVRPYVAQQTVTDLVYGDLRIKVDPNVVEFFAVFGQGSQLSLNYDDITDSYTYDWSELALSPGINHYRLELWGHGEKFIGEYEIVIVSGQVPEEPLYLWPADEFGVLEQIGPKEWTYHVPETNPLETFAFMVEWNEEDIEVWARGMKLVPDGFSYYLHGLEYGEIVPITIKLHNNYHLGNPTIHALTLYNGSI